MSKIKIVYKTLLKFYGHTDAWKEVKEVLDADAKSLNIGEDEFYDPFKNLIIGILSQNTSDRNCTRAYIGLVRKTEITPQALSNLSVEEIREAIKTGGLYNLKAKRIRNLAKTILEKYEGKADLIIVQNSPEETRKRLLELPGIGPKTADVFIAYCMNYGVIPVDTNIARVAKRLGLVREEAGYEEIKDTLEKEIEPKERIRAHELLIRLGRDFCTAKNPSCKNCPLAHTCDSSYHHLSF